MAYFSFLKIIKNLVYAFLNYLKRSTFRVLTIIIVILITILFYSSQTKATYSGPYDKLLDDPIINKMYEDYYQINGSDGFVIVKESNQYIAYLFDINYFKVFIDGNNIKIKNIGNIPKQISTYLADLQGNNRGLYTNTWAYTGNVLTLYPSLEVFAFSGVPIYISLDSTDIWYPANYYTAPFIDTDSNDISKWSFDKLVIDGADESPTFNISDDVVKLCNFELIYDYMGQDYIMDINEFVNVYNSQKSFTISIPKNRLNTYINLYNGEVLSYALIRTQYDYDGNLLHTDLFNLGQYTLNLTTSEELLINETSQKFVDGSIDSNTRLFNSYISNNNINDGYADGVLDYTSNLNIVDNTGISTLFTRIYNAFCTNEVQNITVQIPFTNSYIDINQSNISNKFPDALKNLLSIFYFGIFSIFILKDIRTVINKIYEGNFWYLSNDRNGDIEKNLL